MDNKVKLLFWLLFGFIVLVLVCFLVHILTHGNVGNIGELVGNGSVLQRISDSLHR
jgi:uncharacterized membrane protein